MKRLSKRCAIYTRKSTEDGLDQAFNSLDAQREACEAFIASQKCEGWKAIAERYDDGGVSGGTLERDAIQRLLKDVEAGLIDVVVVYKIDRLTRSLADFAKIVEAFDAKDVSFVSVTQQFNTSTSMGRLTLNVLLSFAQFEREVTAERIRDKIAASKKKGLWMGGYVPLGYDAVDRKLIVNEDEAAIVREIFEAFADGASVKKVAVDLNDRKIQSKARSNGKGGKPFSRGALYKILQNPVYRGRVRHRKADYEGAHEAIIDDALWTKAQERLETGPSKTRTGACAPSPLAGKLFAGGERLTPSHAKKNGKRYRYYVSRSLVEGDASGGGWRLPAPKLESAVCQTIAAWLEEDARRLIEERPRSIDDLNTARTRLEELHRRTNDLTARGALMLWSSAVDAIELVEDKVRITLDLSKPPLDELGPGEDCISIDAPLTLARRGVGRKLILGDAPTKQARDETMIRLVTTVQRWREEVFSCGASLKDLAARDGVDQGDASRFFPLAFLAPDITRAILEGSQPVSLTAERLKRLGDLPADWDAQRTMLGFN